MFHSILFLRMILGMGSASKREGYCVTPSLIAESMPRMVPDLVCLRCETNAIHQTIANNHPRADLKSNLAKPPLKLPHRWPTTNLIFFFWNKICFPIYSWSDNLIIMKLWTLFSWVYSSLTYVLIFTTNVIHWYKMISSISFKFISEILWSLWCQWSTYEIMRQGSNPERNR